MSLHTADTIDTSSAKPESNHLAEPVRSQQRTGPRKIPGYVKFLLFLAVAGAATGGAYKVFGREKFLHGVELVKEQIVGAPQGPIIPDKTLTKSTGPWNGLVKVTKKEQETIGFTIKPALEQTQPLSLELPGQTDYDLDTLNKIRPRFDNALVEKVFVSAGQIVKKGEPLLELRSAELGLAKNECRTKFVQWDHDHKLLVAREPLAKDNRITQLMWTDTQNDEKKSRLDYYVSREKLATYGLTNEQIDLLLVGLKDDNKIAEAAGKNTEDITWMTLLSPIDGVVVNRDAVPGNFYDQINIMLTISPMDKLWVWGNVSESDLDKIHVGQKWDIMFQFSKEKFQGQVESIANGVDLETRTLRIRASIPNPDKALRKGMLVRAYLQIPPTPGDTVIPRNALSVINGEYYAFVEKGKAPAENGDPGDEATLFERRKLEIEQENTNLVIVKKGLTKGDLVVSNGSLILSQMYEDMSTVDSGLPVQ